jgi:transcriptional regulator with XRE-family HTH domain
MTTGTIKAVAVRGVEAIYGAIGMRVRYIREAVGMSQGDLARAIGKTRTVIVNFENGNQRCMLHDIEAMAKALNTTPKHLLRGLWT